MNHLDLLIHYLPAYTCCLYYKNTSLIAQLVKNLPEMQETLVRSLGWEDPLETGKATQSSILEPREFHGLYSPWGCKESDTTEKLSLHFTSSGLLKSQIFFYSKSLSLSLLQ